jgi:hypothetical protein
VEIGDYIPNIIYINRETDKKASGGGGGGRGKGSMTNLEDDDIKAYTTFYNDGRRIGMIVATQDGIDYINAPQISLAINESGEPGSYTTAAYVNADHVNISATSTVYSLAGDLEHDANGKLVIKSAGGMYVQRTEQGTTSQFGVYDNGNLTGGVMVQQINGQTGTITKIAGTVIDIGGLITAINGQSGETQVKINAQQTTIENFLSANTVTIGGLTVTNALECQGIDCGNIDCSGITTNAGDVRCGGTVDAEYLKVADSSATWQSKQISTPTYGARHYFLYSGGSSDYTPSGTSRFYPITSHSESTIHYLGSATT